MCVCVCVRVCVLDCQALSSLRDVASVTITTRTNDSNALTRSCKLDSKGARTGLAATHRVAAGTTVVVSDLFKAAPVRRRCITTGDMEEARRRVETIALAHPGVAFALYNSNTGQQLLKVARTDTACSTFEQIFGSEKSSHLIPVSAQTRSTNTGAGAGKGSHSTNTITVSGYVSVGSHHNRQLQFMYINGQWKVHACFANTTMRSFSLEATVSCLIVRLPICTDARVPH